MPKFKRKSEIIEVMTFDELVEHGRANGANIVNGMPWCFKFHGYGVTHENDECYLIASRTEVIEMTPDHLLIILENGNIGVRDAKSFYDKHELVDQDKGNTSDGYHPLDNCGVSGHTPLKTENLTFGEALELMKKGYRVSRVEWNMNGMWLSLSCNPNGDAVSGRREIAFENFWSNNNSEYARQNGGSAAVLPCITMKTTTGEILFGWAPSQTDMLANDWVWLNDPVSE